MPSSIGGEVGALGERAPLVFLNACRLGSTSPGLVGPAGWAHAVLRVGAAAFVGAHWDVVDARAHRFARELYGRLVAGDAIGRATTAARLATKAAGDPTWFVYTVYASPSARTPSPPLQPREPPRRPTIPEAPGQAGSSSSALQTTG